jgi:hypothetical protein
VEVSELENEFPLEPTDFKSLIPKDEYLVRLAEQKGVCAICRKATTASRRTRVLAVDHDHKTGFIRGLLCTKCNAILGLAKDDPTVLQRAITYLHTANLRQTWPEKEPAHSSLANNEAREYKEALSRLCKADHDRPRLRKRKNNGKDKER